MKNKFLVNLSMILFILILEVKGAKKKSKTNSDDNNAQSDKVLAESAYCQHFKDSEIYLDRNKLKTLDSNQYINEEFSTNKEVFSDATKLDYFIRYSLISRGICYYDEKDVKEINKFDKFLIDLRDINPEQQPYEDTLRYEKTFNCYFYYKQYVHQDSLEELEKHQIALNHCTEYLYGLYSFIYDTNLCPNPKENMIGKFDNIKDQAVRENEYFKQRSDYVQEIKQFYEQLNTTYHERFPINEDFYHFETELEYDTRNLELTLCGYPTLQQKHEHCKIHRQDICCPLKYNQTPYTFPFYKEPMYYGISVAAILMIIGSFFSSKIIKEIKMQENIKKSILDQEKEYQRSNKQNLQNAYNEGFNPTMQKFNSNSRNLNGTLRPGTLRPINNMGTLNSDITIGTNSNSRLTMSSSGATLRSGASMSRYPPNCFNIIEDYISTDPRDITLRRGMIVQLIQKFGDGWIMAKDIQSTHQGYAPEYCLGTQIS